MPWHVQHHFPVDKYAICITVWADRKVSSAEKKLLPKVPAREASTKSPEQSEAFSHFCRAFGRRFHLVFFFFPCYFFPTDSPWKVHLSNLDPKMTGVTVSGLTPARTYQFRVCAVNQVGKGRYSTETSRWGQPGLCAEGTVTWAGKKCCSWMKEWSNLLREDWEMEKLGFPPGECSAAGRSWGWGIWGMQEVSRSWERCPHSPEYQRSRTLEMMFCSCAKPQQLARAGSQLSPCHGNVTSGIYPDVTEKDGFIIFSFKCIPLLLWTKACYELELQNSWTLNGFFKM